MVANLIILMKLLQRTQDMFHMLKLLVPFYSSAMSSGKCDYVSLQWLQFLEITSD